MYSSRQTIFDLGLSLLSRHQLQVAAQDRERPWGGFMLVEASGLNRFIEIFFNDLPPNVLRSTPSQPLSPKILAVLPHKKLSWQYHHRRSEIWKVIQGKVEVVTSFTDEEKEHKVYTQGQIICIEKMQRHRLIGLEEPALIAEIWQHTDLKHLSDEQDIVRVQDDFGRY